MDKREPLMDSAYFENLIQYLPTTVGRFEAVIQKPDTTPVHRKRLLGRLFRGSYQLLLARYSYGTPISQLAESFPSVVESLERYVVKGAYGSFSEVIDAYTEPLWLVSLGILLEADTTLFARLVKCLNNDGKDALYERLVSTRIPNRPRAGSLLWPRPYQTLYEATNGGSDAPKLIQKFLKDWYSSLKDCYWHDGHKGPDGGGFFGYWSLETAGVVKALGIDDESFREMAYYPKDLVHGVLPAAKQ